MQSFDASNDILNSMDISNIMTPQFYSFHCQTCTAETKISKKWMFNSNKMTAQMTEKLYNYGWERNGDSYILGYNKRSCCARYPTRIQALHYKPSKSQIKILKRFNQFLYGERQLKPLASQVDYEFLLQSTVYIQKMLEDIIHGLDIVKTECVSEFFDLFKVRHHVEININDQNFVTNVGKLVRRQGDKLNFEISSDIIIFALLDRIQNEFVDKFSIQAKVSQDGEENVVYFKQPDQFKAFLNACVNKNKQPHEEIKENFKEEEEEKKINTQTNFHQHFKQFVPCDLKKLKRSYSIKIQKAVYTPQNFKVFFKFYKSVFNKSKNKESFTDWLCYSPVYDPEQEKERNRVPFKDTKLNDSQRTPNFIEGIFPKYKGTYNMLHFIDGELIAVGILDFLETYLISTQFYYNPRYRDLGIGKLGVLREIEYINKINELGLAKIQYYAMQSYSPTIPKFSYKIQFNDVELLCLKTKKWVKFSQQVKERILTSKDDICDGFQEKTDMEKYTIRNYLVERIKEKGILFQYSTLAPDFYMSNKLIDVMNEVYFEKLMFICRTFAAELGINLLENFDFIHYQEFSLGF